MKFSRRMANRFRLWVNESLWAVQSGYEVNSKYLHKLISRTNYDWYVTVRGMLFKYLTARVALTDSEGLGKPCENIPGRPTTMATLMACLGSSSGRFADDMFYRWERRRADRSRRDTHDGASAAMLAAPLPRQHLIRPTAQHDEKWETKAADSDAPAAKTDERLKARLGAVPSTLETACAEGPTVVAMATIGFAIPARSYKNSCWDRRGLLDNLRQ